MSNPRNTTRHAPTLRRLAGAAIASAALLAACDDSRQADESIRDARLQMGTLGASGRSAPPAEKADRINRAIVDALTPYSGSESRTGEAASALIAQAKLGQGSTRGIEAVDAYADLLGRVRIARADLSQYNAHSAQADALAAYDPAPELDDLAAQAAAKQAEARAAEDVLAEVTARLDDLDTQVAALDQRTAAERDAAGRLRLEMARANPVEAAEIAERVREVMRRGDALELETARVRRQAEIIEPQVNEARMRLDQLNAQAVLIAANRQEVDQRAADAEQAAAELRARADEAQARVVADLTRIQAFLAADVADAIDAALSEIRAAKTSASRARSVASESARGSAALAQHAEAVVLRTQANALGVVAELLEAAAANRVQGASTLAAQAQELRNAEADSSAQSSEAFRGAAADLRRLRATGDTRAALEESARRLDVLADTPSGAGPDFSETPAADDAPLDSWDD